MSKKYPLLDDKEWLEEKYLEERLSIRAISSVVGCSGRAVWNALKRLKIPTRKCFEAKKGRTKRWGLAIPELLGRGVKHTWDSCDYWLQCRYGFRCIKTLRDPCTYTF